MSGNSRRFLKAISDQINKSPLINNATLAVGNVSGRAQEKLSSLQTAASEKYNVLVKQVNDSTIIQDLNASSSLQPSTPIPKRLVNYWHWYQQLTGLDTVEAARIKVNEVQDKIFYCQEQRRTLSKESSQIIDKLKDIYAELVQIKREDPKYVQLTILENKGLQDQTKIGRKLMLLENEERDYFAQLATAIKEYHDSQAMNAQKYKYLSILASALIAIVSLTASMIYNNRRIVDVRNAVAQSQKQIESNLEDRFVSLESSIVTNIIDVVTKTYGQTRLSELPKGVATESQESSLESLFKKKTQEVTSMDVSISRVKTFAYYTGVFVLSLYLLQRMSGM